MSIQLYMEATDTSAFNKYITTNNCLNHNRFKLKLNNL